MTTNTKEPEALLRESAWLRRLACSLALDPAEGDEIFNTALIAAWNCVSASSAPALIRPSTRHRTL